MAKNQRFRASLFGTSNNVRSNGSVYYYRHFCQFLRVPFVACINNTCRDSFFDSRLIWLPNIEVENTDKTKTASG